MSSALTREQLLSLAIAKHDELYGAKHCDRKYIESCHHLPNLILQAGREHREQRDSETSPSVEVTDRPENATQLADLIESLTVFDHDGGASGYEQSAEALWKAALAAFEYVARKVGPTGYQASWAALRFYGEAMRIDGPFMVTQARDALYPQYDLVARLQLFLEEHKSWLAEQAREKLAEHHGNRHSMVATPVLEHWEKLAGSVKVAGS